MLSLCPAHIERCYIIRTQTGPTVVCGIQDAAARGGVNDSISMPDGTILVHTAR